MDDSAFAIRGDPAEHALHPHTDLHFVRAADNLGSHAWPLIQFYDGEHIGGEGLKLFICGMNNGIGYNFTGPGKLVINDPAIPAAVWTECARGEKIPVTGFAFRPNHVIALGYFSPESCD